MVRTIAVYGLVLAVAAFELEWLRYGHAMLLVDGSAYAAGIAVIFMVIGVWVGARLTTRRPAQPFQPNVQAVRSLGISARESEVLDLLAAGHANKEIARRLGISPNTVKTHVASLLAKLEATRRTQAISKARALDILP
ncbi:MAG: LuxR C-terminal-related transcriptional regulator [Asticcacaulis sp.]